MKEPVPGSFGVFLRGLRPFGAGYSSAFWHGISGAYFFSRASEEGPLPCLSREQETRMPEDMIATIAAERGYSADELEAALEAYRRRQRLSHPAGRFDKAGAFHLDEYCDCCAGLQRSSAKRPYSEMHHARSLTHVAQLYDVPVLHLRRLVKAHEKAQRVHPTSRHAQGQLKVLLTNILQPVHRGARPQ
ncbi:MULTISPECIES: hypothetical protein [unclassified Sulfitobacter]|uniref:hypothetical protein n=1 Tax=unclassified Sulfitobacter TaxID=196795 RepID=UPI0037461D5F